MNKRKIYCLIAAMVIAICGISILSGKSSKVLFNENIEALTNGDSGSYYSYAVSHVRDGNSRNKWYVEPSNPNPDLSWQWCEEAFSGGKDKMCIFAQHSID